MSSLVDLFIFEQSIFYKKIKNLNNQKNIIASPTKLQEDDIELTLIKLNKNSTKLLNEIKKLYLLYKNDYDYRDFLQIVTQS